MNMSGVRTSVPPRLSVLVVGGVQDDAGPEDRGPLVGPLHELDVAPPGHSAVAPARADGRDGHLLPEGLDGVVTAPGDGAVRQSVDGVTDLPGAAGGGGID